MLEVVDLSGNELRGPAPIWLAQMLKATVKKLNLAGNRLTGDYKALAGLSNGFIRKDKTIPIVSMAPQQPCPRTEYLKMNPKSQFDLGTCAVVPAIEAVLVAQSEDLVIDVEKPSGPVAGGEGKAITLVLRVNGGSMFTPQYGAVMTLRIGTQPVSSRTFLALADTQLALAGVHAEWQDVAPSADTAVDLDAADGRFAETRLYKLIVHADCSGTQPCVADGDTIETVFQVGSTTGPKGQYSHMRVSTQIQALPSCRLSTARLQGPAAVDPSTDVLRLEASLVDVDNLPIGVSSPKAYAIWNNGTFPLERDKLGSNLFGWEIPSGLRREPGLYPYKVYLEWAWDEVLRAKVRCMLHEGTVNVAKGFDTTWVLVGSILGAITLIGVALVLILRDHRQLMGIVLMLVNEIVKIGFSLALDIGNIITEYAPENRMGMRPWTCNVRAARIPRLCTQHLGRQDCALRRVPRTQHRAPLRLRLLHHPLNGRRRRLFGLSHHGGAQHAPGATRPGPHNSS